MARQTPIPQDVIDAARLDYQANYRPGLKLKPITLDERIVGFYYPHKCKSGFNLGPIFVLPEFRRLGLAGKLYRSTPGSLIACIRDDNQPSIALHESVGFKRWRRYSSGWWWRRV